MASNYVEEIDKQLQKEQPRKYKWAMYAVFGVIWVSIGVLVFVLSFKELGKYIIYSGLLYEAICVVMYSWAFAEEWVEKKSQEEESST
jgi:energy-converting hydrogenase Eha subunit A